MIPNSIFFNQRMIILSDIAPGNHKGKDDMCDPVYSHSIVAGGFELMS